MAGGCWCPLSNSECRDDCAWADIVVTITEDGMERDVYCAIALVAAVAVKWYGEADDSEHGLGSPLD